MEMVLTLIPIYVCTNWLLSIFSFCMNQKQERYP